MINTLNDNIMLLKDTTRTRLSHGMFQKKSEAVTVAHNIAKHLGVGNITNIIIAKPGTTVIVAKDMVIRLPHDKENEARCRTNGDMLKKLENTGINALVPRFLEESEMNGQVYFCEAKLPGAGLDIPISKMDEMVNKAADLITKFHKETAREIVIDETNFEQLFGKYFKTLSNPVIARSDLSAVALAKAEAKQSKRDTQYAIRNTGVENKLSIIEQSIKSQLMGKKFKTVWMHGDYKIENVLFDTKTWQINGLIDWDLSEEEGLPLLDVLYLLMYKQYTLTKKSVIKTFSERFVKREFYSEEQETINKYSSALDISEEFIWPMLIMFWLHHVSVRYDVKNVDTKDIVKVVDLITTRYAIRQTQYAKSKEQ